MDLCQETGTDLENNENNEIQSTEETELTPTCPDERSEKNHVCCLLNISDITLEEDGRASEFVIGTGWEEAVQGWGKASPTACIWPRKKPKKARAAESDSSSCLFCVSLSQGTPEARSPPEAGKWEAGAGAEGGPEKNWSSPSQARGPSRPSQPSQGPNTASKEIHKTGFSSFHGEKKSLQIKEFIWRMEDWATPETVSGKACRGPSGGVDGWLPSPDCKALFVLPPLKASPRDGLGVLGKKSKNFLWQSEGKVLRAEKDASVAGACGLNTVDGKGEKRHLELAKHLQVTNTPPFPSPAARPSLLADSQQCYLHFSLLPEKNLACAPDPCNVHYLATLQLLQRQGVQGLRARFKAREPRPPRNPHKLILTEAKQENRAQPLATKVLARPLLPSLTDMEKQWTSRRQRVKRRKQRQYDDAPLRNRVLFTPAVPMSSLL